MGKVEILNPLPNSAKFLSEDSARNYVKRGYGVMRGPRFHFYPDIQDRCLQELGMRERRTEEQEFLENRGGIVYWNGSSRNPFALYKPGKVRC